MFFGGRKRAGDQGGGETEKRLFPFKGGRGGAEASHGKRYAPIGVPPRDKSRKKKSVPKVFSGLRGGIFCIVPHREGKGATEGRDFFKRSRKKRRKRGYQCRRKSHQRGIR